MFKKQFFKFLFIFLTVALGAFILFNPYLSAQDTFVTAQSAKFTNDLCRSLNFGYRFSTEDMFELMRFLEYFVFGIFVGKLTVTKSKGFWKSLELPLFIGLLTAVVEIYLRNFSSSMYTSQNIVVSFVEFFAGTLICMIGAKRSKSSKFSGASLKKYNNRRR